MIRSLKECHEVIQRHIGQVPNVVKPMTGPAIKITECFEGDGLTDWEIKFLYSIEQRVSAGWSLTPNQQDTLDRIWRERT